MFKKSNVNILIAIQYKQQLANVIFPNFFNLSTKHVKNIHIQGYTTKNKLTTATHIFSEKSF